MVRRSRRGRYTPPKAYKSQEWLVGESSPAASLVPLEGQLLRAASRAETGLRSALKIPERSCISSSMVIRDALALLGIKAAVQSLAVEIISNQETVSSGLHGGDGPRYSPDGGVFDGHAVVVAPSLGRFCDPTVGQYRGGSKALVSRIDDEFDWVPEGRSTFHAESGRVMNYVVESDWNDRWATDENRPNFSSGELAASYWESSKFVASMCIYELFIAHGSSLTDTPFPFIAGAAEKLAELNGEPDVDSSGSAYWADQCTGRTFKLEDLTGVYLSPLPYYRTGYL